MMRHLAEKRVVVTGASSGIGQAVAEQLVSAGAKVLLVARSVEKLAQIAEGIRDREGDAIPFSADLTLEADRERIARYVAEHWGGLDILVNNAGVASWGHFATSTEEINRQIFELNFFAPLELTRNLVPLLMKGQQPAVVNVTSMCARRGMPAWPEYSASKFALMGMTEAWRGEMARFDIDVITIVPGLTQTDLSRNLLRNEGRANIRHDQGMTCDFVARSILRAIQKNRREVVLGSEAKWIILLNRFFPSLLNRLIARRIRKLYAQP